MRRIELESKSKQELLDLARDRGIPGRSQLSKEGLIRALLKDGERARPLAFAPREVRRADSRSRSGPAKKGAAAPREEKPAPRAEKTTPPAPKAAPRPPAGQSAPPRAGATAKKAAAAKADKRPASKAQKPAARPVEKARPRVTAAAERSSRGGPYGPESERLHGAVPTRLVPPAARTAAAADAGPRAPAGTTAASAGPRRGVGAPLAWPERYGRSYAVLMARDPHWLYAYWEIRPEDVDKLRAKLGEEWNDHRWVLRVFSFPPEVDFAQAEEGNGEDRYDVELSSEAQSWYLNVGRADRVYRYAVGVVTRAGKFYALARSNAVRTPRDAISPVTDEEWTRAPESYKRLYEMMGDGLTDGRSSAELGMLLRERLRADWSSGMMGSMGSGALARPPLGAPGFWFVLDAELIIYGATEPDASVTVQGRPVRLRPDGTFSLRFQLPDGTQVIDATAVSADGAFRKTITPTVRRETNSTETIETRVGS